MPVKNGVAVDEKMTPVNPTLHVQPAGTLAPLLLSGHATTEKALAAE